MTNDVKALPVVAYMWMFRDSVWDISSMKGRYLSMGEDHTEHPLVRQSDAESALAELRAEVERLRAELRAYDESPAACYSASRIESAEQRADTAEARLERASGLLDLASQHVKSNARLKNAIDAFLGEGNG